MDELIQTTTIEVIPKGMFSNDFVFQKNGEEIGWIDLKAMREAATLYLGDEVYEMGREGMMSGAFFLAQGEKVMLKADKPSAFKSEFVFLLGDPPVVLRKPSMMRSDYELVHNETLIGRVTRDGLFTRKATLEVPAEWPLPLQLFIFWLVQLMWSRESAAAS